MCHINARVTLSVSVHHALRLALFGLQHFETNAPNEPQMTFNTTRSEINHICLTGVTESEIAPLNQPFESYRPFETSAKMTIKSPQTLQGVHRICVTTIIPNFSYDAQVSTLFHLQDVLKLVHRMTPK